jgi:hypothetical protein
MYGKLIFLGSVVGYLGSIPCYWLAGKAYVKNLKDKEEKEKLANA